MTCSSLIFMNTKLNFRIAWFCALLIGYWVLLILFPAHDLGSTDIFSREGNLASHIDRLLMPGRLYLGNHDPEGLLSTIPAIGTALLGMFTGEFLLSKYLSDKPLRKVLYMVLVAIVLMIIGKIWNIVFPINKNLWTSSFVLHVGGWSLLLLSLFYYVIDVKGYRKWAFFFTIIGMNSILIYMSGRFINWGYTTKATLGWLGQLAGDPWNAVVMAICYVMVKWCFLYFMYRQKIFLRV